MSFVRPFHIDCWNFPSLELVTWALDLLWANSREHICNWHETQQTVGGKYLLWKLLGFNFDKTFIHSPIVSCMFGATEAPLSFYVWVSNIFMHHNIEVIKRDWMTVSSWSFLLSKNPRNVVRACLAYCSRRVNSQLFGWPSFLSNKSADRIQNWEVSSRTLCCAKLFPNIFRNRHKQRGVGFRWSGCRLWWIQ